MRRDVLVVVGGGEMGSAIASRVGSGSTVASRDERNGERLATAETRLRHPPQRHTRSPATVVAVRPQLGHIGPVGQRSQCK